MEDRKRNGLRLSLWMNLLSTQNEKIKDRLLQPDQNKAYDGGCTLCTQYEEVTLSIQFFGFFLFSLFLPPDSDETLSSDATDSDETLSSDATDSDETLSSDATDSDEMDSGDA